MHSGTEHEGGVRSYPNTFSMRRSNRDSSESDLISPAAIVFNDNRPVSTPPLSPKNNTAEPKQDEDDYYGRIFEELEMLEQASPDDYRKYGVGRTTSLVRAQNGNGSTLFHGPASNIHQRKRPANDDLDEAVDGRPCKRMRLGDNQY